jgi:hypothetical protein
MINQPALALALALLCLFGSFVSAADTQKPNVLIVMTDDQGLGDFSFTGNPVLKTPNLDAFARESVRFTDFHVCPMCSPTRGQLLTGLAALRNGATSVTAGRTFLRPGLATWWKAIEPRLNDFVPQSIGAGQQPVVELTSGDCEGIYADNSGYVREAVGGPAGGLWHIKVEAAGEYEFALRRWPERTRAALGDKYEPSPVSPSNKPNLQTVGFPTIARAKIEIAGVRVEETAVPTATAATIRVTLSAGTTTLKAWFADAEDQDLCGAFFVTVRKVQ